MKYNCQYLCSTLHTKGNHIKFIKNILIDEVYTICNICYNQAISFEHNISSTEKEYLRYLKIKILQ